MRKGGIYLALGDSITWTQVTAGADLYASRIAAAIGTTYAPIKHYNKGLGGIHSGILAEPNFLRWATMLEPDLVTIGIGMNDAAEEQVSVATYKTNLATVIDTLQLRNPDVHIILCTPNHTSSATRIPYIAGYRTAMAEVATSKAVSIAHFEDAFTEGDVATYCPDGVHPNTAGHALLYEVLWPVVRTGNWLATLAAG